MVCGLKYYHREKLGIWSDHKKGFVCGLIYYSIFSTSIEFASNDSLSHIIHKILIVYLDIIGMHRA